MNMTNSSNNSNSDNNSSNDDSRHYNCYDSSNGSYNDSRNGGYNGSYNGGYNYSNKDDRKCSHAGNIDGNPDGNSNTNQIIREKYFRFVLFLITAFVTTLLITVTGCQSDAGLGDVRIYRPHAVQTGAVRKNKGHFTIVLDIFDQPGSQQAAASFRKQAMLKLGSNDVWLYNDFGVLDVNYGHFNTHAEAKQQIDRVHKLFGMSYIREIPEPDPPAPMAWNLLNSSCFYSLEIATYYDVPEKGFYNRKESAVKAVERLRKLGEKAYFVHGRANSCVYVGCFGPGALRTTWKNGLRIRTPSPVLQALINKYPVHYENGFKIYYHKIRNIGGQQKEGPRIPYPNRVVMVNALRQNIPF